MEKEKSHVVVKVLPYDDSKPLPPRLSVEQLLCSPKYSKQRDLFLQAFAAVQQKAADDPKGYFQISGIHGMPYAPYDRLPGEILPPGHWTPKDKNSGRWGGYCHHGDILFPTWHRPYMMLMEQMVYYEASDIADLYIDEKKKEYKDALETLRFPYWDWASPYTLSHGIPSIFTDKTVMVNAPPQKDNYKMSNPLRAFTIPVDLGVMQLVGDTSNPTQRPYVPPLSNHTPFTPAGFSTVRHPNSDYRSQVDTTNLNVIMFCSTIFRPTIYQTLTLENWHNFSCHKIAPKNSLDDNYGHFASIEVVHDALHDAVGGEGGHMSFPDVAPMDPIFYFHHANTDRLIAIWQACHPEAWIEPSTDNIDMAGSYTLPKNAKIDEDTPLVPFRKLEDQYWTSKDVRNINNLGYTYPELADYKTKEDLLKRMVDYYHPNRYLKLHWCLNLTVGKNKVGGPFQIRVFIDLPTATADTPLTVPNFAGLVSVFARGTDTVCAQCLSKPNATVSGSVDLTICMQRLGITLNPEDASSLEPKQIKLVVVRRDSSAVPLQDAGVICAEYFTVDESSDLPSDWVRKKRGDLLPFPNVPSFV